SPSVVTQAQNVSLAVVGTNTNWVNGLTTAVFNNTSTDQNSITLPGAGTGDNGISVSGQQTQLPGTVSVTDATHASIQIAVSASPALGPWRLTMDTPPPPNVSGITEVEALAGAITITGVSPPGSAVATVSTIAGVAGTAGFTNGAGSSALFNHPSL